MCSAILFTRGRGVLEGDSPPDRDPPLWTETPSRQPLPELTSHLVAVTAVVSTHPTGMPYFNMFVEERESANECPVHRHTYLKWFSQRVLESSPYFLLSRTYWSQNKRPILFNYQYHSRTRDYKPEQASNFVVLSATQQIAEWYHTKCYFPLNSWFQKIHFLQRQRLAIFTFTSCKKLYPAYIHIHIGNKSVSET